MTSPVNALTSVIRARLASDPGGWSAGWSVIGPDKLITLGNFPAEISEFEDRPLTVGFLASEENP